MTDFQHPDDPLRLDRQICFPLYAASNLINRLYRPVLSKLGLTYPQYLVMLALWETSPRTVGSLGGALYLDSGTLTPLLKRMEGAGLVTRQRDPDDERRVQISLTPEGMALREDALKVPETLTAGFEGDPSEVERLRDGVQALVGALANHGKPGTPEG